MRSILTLFFLATVCAAAAQTTERQVISSGGLELTSPECRISFTLGEGIATTLKSSQLILTQGFQQPLALPLNAPLPVTLVHFSGSLKNGMAHLEWETAEEWNTCCFKVERSENGLQFHALSTVQANGHTGTAHTYSTIDSLPLSPLGYYRLQILDKDGKSAYSPLVVIKNDHSNGFSVFPNPVRGRLFISVKGMAQSSDHLRVLNLQGQELMKQQVQWLPGANTISVDVSLLPAGLYLIHSTSHQFPPVQFIKQ